MDFFEDDDLLGECGTLSERSAWGPNPERETLDTLNHNARAIRGLAAEVREHKRTLSELRQQSARMAVTAQEQYSRAIAATERVWEPGGDDALAVRLYGVEAGGVRMLASKRDVVLPGGHTRTVKLRGFLTDPYPVTRAQQEIQRRYLGFSVAVRVCRTRKIDPWANEIVQRAYVSLTEAIERQPGQLGRVLRESLDTAVRAMSGGTGVGAEWILEPQIDTLIRPYDLTSTFMARIQKKDAPSKLFTRPTVTGEIVFYRAGDVTSNDPGAYRVSDLTTGEASQTIPEFAARMVLSKTWLDDMAKLVSMEELTSQIRRGADRTLRGAWIHGDTAATHQDAVASWTVGGKYTAGTMGGSDSPFRQILGLRARAADDSNTNDCGQTFSAAVAMASLERLGSRAQSDQVGWLTGMHVLHTQLMPDADFLTADKIGSDMATVRTGRFGSMLGHPVDVDDMITNDLDATTGLFDGSGDTTSILLAVDWSAVEQWTLQEQQDFEVLEAHKGAVHLGATMRVGGAFGCASGEKPVSLDFDL